MSEQTDPNISYGPEQRPWIEQLPDFARDAEGLPMVEPPSANPIEVYENTSGIYDFEEQQLPERCVEVPPSGLTNEQKRKSLQIMGNYLFRHRNNFLGYQVSEQQKYSHELEPYLNMMINNIGDPFVDGYYNVNSKPAERAVMDFFASLWHAQWPAQSAYTDKEGMFHPAVPDSYWGYVLSMGSTEGNFYAVLNARDYLSGCRLVSDIDGKAWNYVSTQHKPSAENPNVYTPIAFYSEDTHYSVNKAVHAMNVKTFYQEGMEKYQDECPLEKYRKKHCWPERVPSAKPSTKYPIGPGTTDIDALVKLVEFFAAKGYPILIVLNYGTTFKGAYDDVKSAGEKLMPIFEKYNLAWRKVAYHDLDSQEIVGEDWRTGYWIHVDGALGASFMPFVEMLYRKGQIPAPSPQFDFRLPFVHSLVTSGHKWLGTPMPTGIYMSKQKYLVLPSDAPTYLGAPDSTFAGSRNGLSAMILWDLVARGGYSIFFTRAKRTLELTDYAYNRLYDLSEWLKHEFKIDIWLQRSSLSMSIIFRKPKDDIMFKYSLCVGKATEVYVDGEIVLESRTYVHMFCLWDRNEQMFDELVKDLAQPSAFSPN